MEVVCLSHHCHSHDKNVVVAYIIAGVHWNHYPDPPSSSRTNRLPSREEEKKGKRLKSRLRMELILNMVNLIMSNQLLCYSICY